MKKSQISFFTGLALLGSFLIAGCTGYADGPAINLKSAKTKIANTWRVDDASLNGVETTSSYTDDFLKFEESGDFTYFDALRLISIPPFTQDTLMPMEGFGDWQFLDGGKQLEVFYTFQFKDPYNPDITYSEDINERWEVTRLAEGELWLRNDSTILKLEFF